MTIFVCFLRLYNNIYKDVVLKLKKKEELYYFCIIYMYNNEII